MKLKKGLICCALIMCILINSISMAAAGIISTSTNSQQSEKSGVSYSQTFPDLQDHWCKDYIDKFLSRKWVVGYEDGLFRPDRNVTRAEFTAMVVRIFMKTNYANECGFTDVKKEDWFYNAVAQAANEGLIQGYENSSFKPMDNMSRQDAAVLVAKLFDVNFFEGAKECRFEDDNTFPEYSSKSIKNLASHEIIKGYPDGTFRPYRLITRAEAVRMLDVVLKYIEVPEETMPAAPPQTPTPVPTSTNTPKSTSKPSKNTSGSRTEKSTAVPRPTSTPTPTSTST